MIKILLRRSFLTYNIFDTFQIYSLTPKDQKKNIICTMDDEVNWNTYGTCVFQLMVYKVDM